MIKTIALDYGNVLARPASGDWMLPKNLGEILGLGNTMKFLKSVGKMKGLMEEGMAYLGGCHKLTTEEEEFAQFKEFYRIVFGGCGITKGLDGICEQMAQMTVYSSKNVLFFDDAVTGIEALRERYKVIVISDTWPSVKRTLTESGVYPLLDGLVISCDHGLVKKDGPRLFEVAMEQYGIEPAECLFVDDSAKNLEQAAGLGFHVALMDRDGKAEESAYYVVGDLAGVLARAGEL